MISSTFPAEPAAKLTEVAENLVVQLTKQFTRCSMQLAELEDQSVVKAAAERCHVLWNNMQVNACIRNCSDLSSTKIHRF
jgi:hypothetical protein